MFAYSCLLPVTANPAMVRWATAAASATTGVVLWAMRLALITCTSTVQRRTRLVTISLTVSRFGVSQHLHLASYLADHWFVLQEQVWV